MNTRYKIAAEKASLASINLPYEKRQSAYIKVFIETLKELDKTK